MKTKAYFLLFALLTACGTPKSRETVFIDANISADVYFGDKKVGTTPFMDSISGKEREVLTLRKEGYKTVSLPIKKSYPPDYRPGILFYSSDVSMSDCSDKQYSYFGETGKSSGTPEGCLYLPLLVFLTPTYGIGVTILTADLTPRSAFLEYDRDSYYVEMVPLNKKAYTKDDLKRLKIKLMVLKSFKELKAGDSERMFSVAALTGKAVPLPAPEEMPGAYLRRIAD